MTYLDDIDDAKYEGDHERLEYLVGKLKLRIDPVTAEEIADAKYEGDHERVQRIYQNLRNSRRR